MNGDAPETETLDPELRVDDDEYVRRRRLKAINDAREAAARMPARARLEVQEGNITPDEARVAVFEAVQTFLREVRKPIEAVDGAEQAFDGVELARLYLTPPDDVDDPRNHQSSMPADATLLSVSAGGPHSFDRDTHEFVIEGLNFFLQSGPSLTSRWSAVWRSATTVKERTLTKRQPVPERASVQAFDLAVDLLEDTDLVIDTSHQRDEFEHQYADLIPDDPSVNGHK